MSAAYFSPVKVKINLRQKSFSASFFPPDMLWVETSG